MGLFTLTLFPSGRSVHRGDIYAPCRRRRPALASARSRRLCQHIRGTTAGAMACCQLGKSQIPLRYLVRSWFEPVTEFGFEPVCDQLRTSFEPASVMEFGFNTPTAYTDLASFRIRLRASPLDPSRRLSRHTFWSSFIFSRLDHCQCRALAVDWDNAAAA